jgi:uncharacterized membrane protein
MDFDPWTVAAILGMAAATYLCRGGGYWLFRQVTPGPMLRAALSYIPGTLFVSFVAPGLLDGHAHTLVGAAATVAVMLWTRSLALSIIAGTAAAWLAWSLV